MVKKYLQEQFTIQANDRTKNMISVNCGAIPEGIIRKRTVSDIRKVHSLVQYEARKGYFEIADGGTLFFDEIAEMPLTTQVKILRALEFKEFMRTWC
ncbi:MAG: sigma-54 factor interaction domain-containing protein [Ignavibacteriales bacterium]|nr:sigma-54 factor interaction domain-containing protein [Ignavibacteriales bacterium]